MHINITESTRTKSSTIVFSERIFDIVSLLFFFVKTSIMFIFLRPVDKTALSSGFYSGIIKL